MITSGKQYIRCLTIAGSDSGGGAGIQADLKTFSALECYGASVITALTAQNTKGVTGIHDVSAEFVGEQLEAVLSDIDFDAIKIGMLHDPAIIKIIAGKLKQYNCRNIVLDPVMVSKSGHRLLKPEAIASLKTYLFPLAAVITPNLPEAGDLLGRTIETKDQMPEAARDLLALGAKAVLLKGGHLTISDSADYFMDQAGNTRWFSHPRIATRNTHGTGCTFSSAIAAHLAKGLDLIGAAGQAKDYLSSALLAGSTFTLGHGHGPVHHFYAQQKASG